MNIPKILERIRPKAAWTLHGADFVGIIWHDEEQAIPTLEEMEQGQLELDTLEYRNKRAAEYPPIGDQLDALWKGGDDATAMLKKVLEVKNKYPKTI